ncbi:MAG: acetate/propionate family kinase, partial [Thermohalobaculum sp.]
MEKIQQENKLIFVLNAGSSSLKFALLGKGMNKVLYGLVSEIGKHSTLTVAGDARSIECISHKEALKKIFDAVAEYGISMKQIRAVGHRIVHGGVNLTSP